VNSIGHPLRTACLSYAAVFAILAMPPAQAAEPAARPLTVGRPRVPAVIPVVPSPALPGAPIPWSGSPVLTPLTLSIVDGQTRFLTEGVAQEHCPGDRVLFFSGVVNPFRPSLPGDGAFICHRDAVAEGFAGP
jgi:hypothetical protein